MRLSGSFALLASYAISGHLIIDSQSKVTKFFIHNQKVNMRIISGKYKNQNVMTPEGVTTRPMLSRIRKSVMDIVQPYLQDGNVLDLFCGTGILALEAFSRGARYCISIDADALALDAAKRNLERICKEGESYQVLRGDVVNLIPRIADQGYTFDVIGITPPYQSDWNDKTLKAIDENPAMLKPDTVIFAQRDKREDIQLEWSHFEHVRTKVYGRTMFEFFMTYEIQRES